MKPTSHVLGTAVVSACLIVLLLTAVRQSRSFRVFSSRDNEGSTTAGSAKTETVAQDDGSPRLQGAEALEYLAKTDDGRSLTKAVTAARFGLKWQEQSPFGDAGGGYLGMSHVQNLNAWFDAEGVTIRPTLPEEDRAKAWRLGMRLKAYGYGTQLLAAPPVVSQKVEENRIEYQRASDFGMRNADFGLKAAHRSGPSGSGLIQSMLSSIPQSAVRSPQLAEWYENRAAGIEQGFTLNVPPDRAGGPAGEPLRLTVKLEGDLRARANGEGREVHLLKQDGDAVLSYGQLVARDSAGHLLPAHMETNREGDEIALVVQDAGATYPIDIDPVTATLEQKLTKPNTPQAGAEFGDAVAISGNVAVLGAFLEDVGATVDEGVVYIFTRSGSTWTFKNGTPIENEPSAQCGWGVAIDDSGTKVAVGCPGILSNRGIVVLLHTNDFWSSFGRDSIDRSNLNPGDRFGESVALFGNTLVVGAPSTNLVSFPHAGVFYVFDLGSSFIVLGSTEFEESISEGHLGTSVAIDGNTLIAGEPSSSPASGRALIYSRSSGSWQFVTRLAPNDGAPGDVFGYSVAISGNTAVVGAPLNDNAKGTDAGAAYVFVRDGNGNWVQQQKLIASDGIDQDQFGESVAIEGNTIVVGSPYNGSKTFTGTRGNGRSYVFTRNVNTWTEQTIISALFDGAPVDEFGIAVGLSGDTVISGAEHAEPGGTTNAGAAYIHRLSCVPPWGVLALGAPGLEPSAFSYTICPGVSILILSAAANEGATDFQWRKNGVNIPGATGDRYSINNASASDAGNYDVIVRNSCGGEISPPFTLTVHTLSINPTSQNFGAAGSTSIVNVTSSGSCAWTAVSNASWITVTSGASGTGNGTVGFNIAANPTTSQRTGTITIARQTFTVSQDAAAPTPTPTPTPNVVQFSSSNYSVQEDCTTVTITVNRIGDTSGAATVDYATSDVTATARRDYITALGKLQFAPGETSKTLAVLINEDSYSEGNETFNITLSNPAGVSLGTSVATVTIVDDPTEPSTNAIDDTPTFVCQQYHDFLNRQADGPGQSFWTNEITSCGANVACIEPKRVNTSGAFYLSIEFQQTGYLVERLYKTSYGNFNGTSTLGGSHNLVVPIIRLSEFLPDTQRIGQGVVVGQGDWQTSLENNKQAFCLEFVQRSRFTTAFPTTMTPAQFVDALNANAGNVLSVSERTTAINLFGGAGNTTNTAARAQALRSIAEDSDLVSAETNRAFVLMQYFGYLRRDPNATPDSDYTGYDFWLTKLNQFSGNYLNAEMVKAFITSNEYRSRFGP